MRAPSRAARPGVPRVVEHLPAHGREPRRGARLTQMNAEIDVRHVLPAIRVPTLVLHRTDDRCLHGRGGPLRRRAHSRARNSSSCPATTTCRLSATRTRCSTAIEQFLDGAATQPMRTACSPPSCTATRRGEPARTGSATAIRRARAQGTRMVSRPLLELSDTGGFIGAFDGPARAIRCAAALGCGRRHASGRRPQSACTRANVKWRGSACAALPSTSPHA